MMCFILWNIDLINVVLIGILVWVEEICVVLEKIKVVVLDVIVI